MPMSVLNPSTLRGLFPKAATRKAETGQDLPRHSQGAEQRMGVSTQLGTVRKADRKLLNKWSLSLAWRPDVGLQFASANSGHWSRGWWEASGFLMINFSCSQWTLLSALMPPRPVLKDFWEIPLWEKWNKLGNETIPSFFFHNCFLGILQRKPWITLRPVVWHLWEVFLKSIWFTCAKNCYKGTS